MGVGIEVYARIRPSRTVTSAQNYTINDDPPSTVDFIVPKDVAAGVVNNQKERYQFGFHHIFDQKTTQQEVFDRLGRKIAVSVLDGFNGTIFAYGQTGSGKTFTITGGQYSYEDRGIIPRTLAFVFEETARRVRCALLCFVPFPCLTDCGVGVGGSCVFRACELPRDLQQ